MKRILIADDSFYQRIILSRLVEELGHKSDGVGSGEELLERIDSSYDCIFLDLLMTGMSGIEVLEILKDQENVPPIIVITADVQKSRKKECLELGAVAFIQKMITKQELQETLNEIFS